MRARSRSRILDVVAGLLALGAAMIACAAIAPSHEAREPESLALPPNAQEFGDPEAGREYLLYGDYIGSGIPAGLFDLLRRAGPEPDVLIRRKGRSAELPHVLNRSTAPNGVEVVGGLNCLACHASRFNGRLVIGMGNSLADWTSDGQRRNAMVRRLASMAYDESSPERRILEQFLRGSDAVEGHARTPFRGVTPAFRIEELAASHRDPADLSWSEEEVFQPLDRTIASDVPPLWNVDKKAALYYNGMGRGDFARLIQQIGVVGIKDARDAERITPGMRDLLAYLGTLEPPEYPGAIDAELAARGEAIFAAQCAECHGTYGEKESYPNKLVPIERIGTDPEYARALRESGLWSWYNRSWYAQSPDGPGRTSYAEPRLAYIAPPLDGIWCTAPYLHNGSVPTLAVLLDSSKRPTRWRRSFEDDDYDLERVGWRYEPVAPGDAKGDRSVYDTTVPGYGNTGHTFGDDLTEAERRALIEYLKGL